MPTPDLGNAARTTAILKKYDFAFRRRWGQNFLIDAHVLDKITAASGVTKGDMVLEIGPGIGTLTQYLSCAAGRVLAVEIDPRLIPILAETLEGYDNVTVINDDILKVDIAALAAEYNGGRPIRVVANLPYYITTPILMGLFEKHVPMESLTVMVQREVGDRIKAVPGSKDYGALSLAVQYYARPYLAARVPPNCFLPRPTVGSSVMSLNVYEKPPVAVEDAEGMFRLIRAAFNQRRKTLVNSLGNAPELNLTKDEIREALEDLGLPAAARGEALTLEQFAALSDRLFR